jgi:hypothetical protein
LELLNTTTLWGINVAEFFEHGVFH